MNSKPNVFGTKPGFAFVLQEGPNPPAPDSIRVPGTTIQLVRGERTQITVVNRAPVPVSVHWHGIELESYYDGVAGWSGENARTAPMIAPNDSFIVRMTPDRAGTFIYHTHADESGQLSSGLYGPLLITERGEPIDTATNKVFLLGLGGPTDDAPPWADHTRRRPHVSLPPHQHLAERLRGGEAGLRFRRATVARLREGRRDVAGVAGHHASGHRAHGPGRDE